jgi:hypothetical protein
VCPFLKHKIRPLKKGRENSRRHDSGQKRLENKENGRPYPQEKQEKEIDVE